MTPTPQNETPFATGAHRRWKPALTLAATLARVRELSKRATLRPSPLVLHFADPASADAPACATPAEIFTP